MRRALEVIFAMLSLSPVVYGQASDYAFSSKSAPAFESFGLKRVAVGEGAGRMITFIPALFQDNEGGVLQFLDLEIRPDSVVNMFTISKGEKVISQFILSDFSPNYPENVEMTDLNNDGRKDLVLQFETGGNGLASNWRWVFILFQREDLGFDFHRFTNMLPDEAYGLFRDFDGDGRFELVVGNHTNVSEMGSPNSHSYWFFNVFGWSKGKPINLNEKWGFPLVYRHLQTINRKPDTQISDVEKKQHFFLNQLPEYDFSKGDIKLPFLLDKVFRAEDYRPGEQVKESNRPKSNKPIRDRNLIFYMIGGTGLFILISLSLLWLRGVRKIKI